LKHTEGKEKDVMRDMMLRLKEYDMDARELWVQLKERD